MVKKDVINRKIHQIHEQLDHLDRIDSDGRAPFIKSRIGQDATAFVLYRAIQNCVGIASHIIADRDWGAPDSMRGLFEKLKEKGVIKGETCSIVSRMIDFRNSVLHAYEEPDPERIYNMKLHCRKNLDRFLAEVCLFLGL